MKFKVTINGLDAVVNYQEEDLEQVFYPMIQTIIDLQKQKNRRTIVFLSAPPALGKSTLVACLEVLAKKKFNNDDFQSIGIDGFHQYNEYLIKHDLKKVKGAIHTFNKEKLKETLKQTIEKDTYWPVYDRNLHDPIEDAIYINKKIILLEGNYLSHPLWDDLKEYCDYSIFIGTKNELVKERLIQRKIKGGLSKQEAIDFYEASDKKNVEEVLSNHVSADIELFYDGTHYIVNKS